MRHGLLCGFCILFVMEQLEVTVMVMEGIQVSKCCLLCFTINKYIPDGVCALWGGCSTTDG
jgi:hypothetical protein